MDDEGNNAYERARLQRIAANRKRLSELVTDTSHALAEALSERPIAASAPPRKKAASIKSVERRGSSRLANLPAVDYAIPVEDNGSSRKPGAPRNDHGLARGAHNRTEGTSCHFCRQKTDAYKARCTTCTALFCAPCLWLRHGAKAAEVNESNDWICPKCRLSCTCSICRRKAGKEPTGVLGPKALALGYAGAEGFLTSDCVFKM